MSDNKSIKKSLIEQIYDELIKRLIDKDCFDEELLQKIKELAVNGELKKHTKLQSVLKQNGGSI